MSCAAANPLFARAELEMIRREHAYEGRDTNPGFNMHYIGFADSAIMC